MKYETLRNKTVQRGKTRIFRSGAERSMHLIRNSKRRKTAVKVKDNQSVLLLSEPFLRSLNKAIDRIEKLEIAPLTSRVNNEVFNEIEEITVLIDLPQLGDMDVNLLHVQSSVAARIKEVTGIQVMYEQDDEYVLCITIEELQRESSFEGWYCGTYEEIDNSFSQGSGILSMIFVMYLYNNGQLGNFATRGIDLMMDSMDMELEDIEPEDKETLKEHAIEIRQMVLADERFYRMLEYMNTKIDLVKVIEILRRYDAVIIADAFEHLDKWTKHWDVNHQPFVEYSNIFDITSWVGNEKQYVKVESWLNEDYGNEGTYIQYLSANTTHDQKLNDALIQKWREVKALNLLPNRIEHYTTIINLFTDGKLFKEFAGLSGYRHCLTALHKELDGMPGSGQGGDTRWESLATATSFSHLFKEAYRLFTRERKGKLQRYDKNFTS